MNSDGLRISGTVAVSLSTLFGFLLGLFAGTEVYREGLSGSTATLVGSITGLFILFLGVMFCVAVYALANIQDKVLKLELQLPKTPEKE